MNRSQAADACGIKHAPLCDGEGFGHLLEQLRTIDKQRLKEKICHIDGALLQEVDRALKVRSGTGYIKSAANPLSKHTEWC
ncbi:MAG: type II toxin-antitoxin system PemK/MazF family toxin [Clostridium fessum]